MNRPLLLSTCLLALLTAVGCSESASGIADAAGPATRPAGESAAGDVIIIPEQPKSLTREDWQRMLDDKAFAILREDGTERAHTSPLNKEKREGVFHCAGCGNALYASGTKFESGTGWPSFYKPVSDAAVQEKDDTRYGMVRTELECARCDGHLGHVFPDAPQTPTGLRHCINGAAMVFVPEGQDIQTVLAAYRAKVAE